MCGTLFNEVVYKKQRLARLAANKWVQRAMVWGFLIGLYELAALAVGDFFLPRLAEILVASSLSDFRRKSFVFNNDTFRPEKLSVSISTSYEKQRS